MKHTLKIILPIILILAIVIGACWFFLIARRDVTESIFVYWGEHFYEAGRYSRAVAFYKAAMRFAPKDAELAIRLADAYKKSGNYTKAEYTLVSAITQIPDSVSLYVALSGTYVEQDKLMDAAALLESIQDPAIKASIETLRPAAPTANYEPGLYSQYINVELEAPSGSIYYTTNGEYPSVAVAPYSAPIVMPAGETMIQAICVDTTGLVSPLTVLSYTVGGVIEPAVFTDAAIEASVREILNVSANKTIYTDALWSITEFTIPEGVTNLTDLYLLPYLTSLTAQNLNLTDFNGLAALGRLEKLKELGAYERYKPDVVLYDVLGDVVCGGFAAPIREGYAEKVLIVTSGEKMALYAANNISSAVRNFEDRSYARVFGIVLNHRNVENETEKVQAFSEKSGIPIVGEIPRSDEIIRYEDQGMTVIEGDKDSAISKRFFDLAELLLKSEE